jgi:hypothetical protein
MNKKIAKLKKQQAAISKKHPSARTDWEKAVLKFNAVMK